MKIKIDKFKLAGYYPYNPIKEESMELGQKLLGCTPWIEAEVPGSIYKDLLNANLIKNPYYNMDSLLVEWVPTRWWVYISYFDKPLEDDDIYLIIEGINYKAHIFVNNELLGTTENMFVPKDFQLKNLKSKDNELKIILEHAPDEYGQIGYTSKTTTQKSRFDYKWDFSIRMIDIGIWKPIYLETRKKILVENYHIRMIDNDVIQLDLEVNQNLNGPSLLLNLMDNEKNVISEKIKTNGNKSYSVKIKGQNIKKWNTHDIGYPNLYQLTIDIEKDSEINSLLKTKVGFRNLKFVHNVGSPADALPYTLELNNQKLYMKGVNIVPLDMMMGVVTYERYEMLIKQLVNMNVNIIRVWGGGMIAPKMFYDLCDEYGILIWQDFVQSSSGIDNYPSHDETFIEKMIETVEYTTKTRRNHPSLAVLCGGNELMFPDWRPVDLTVPNISIINKIIQKNCPEIPFYPSTPSGKTFAARFDNPNLNHDIHGEWRYLGVKKHYQHFNNLKNLLHSEFGVDGMTNWETLKKTMPEELLKVESYKDSIEWRHRSEWWNTYEREKSIFGRIESMKDFVDLSQFIQFEGLKYAVDSNRRNIPYQSGSIIWQANEPFPNGSCTSLIDYYGYPKLAYYGIKESFQKISFSIKYDKLVYLPEENVELEIFAVSDIDDDVTYEVNILADGTPLLTYQERVKVFAYKSVFVKKIGFKAPLDKHTILINIKIHSSLNESHENNTLLIIEQENKKELQQKIIEFTKEIRNKYKGEIK